jgi:hypothetical protein
MDHELGERERAEPRRDGDALKRQERVVVALVRERDANVGQRRSVAS